MYPSGRSAGLRLKLIGSPAQSETHAPESWYHARPYEIQAPLGAGGMGEVYKARDTRLDRTVAIKVLPEHVASDPDLKQRLQSSWTLGWRS